MRCECGAAALGRGRYGEFCRKCAAVLAGRTCEVENCEFPVRGNGKCAAHEWRAKHGKPLDAPVTRWRPRQ